ncbi:MAG: Crp/Fnr family transcriptional regulator [Deltaproteobacteria bacterium]|nr:Crp/Fnr family transcriptional regulator [Deltaproteobacteria bacterium]MBN2687451.1 Crp/Fnr family transcriptional regulator [Deltaproteobacteria bacterium]
MKTYERLFRRFGRVYRKGTYIFEEGDEGRDMFFILEGHVRVEKQAGGLTKTLIELKKGDYFGEMAAIIEAPRSASALAVEDCSIAVIDSETFSQLLRESSDISLLFLREFSHRLTRTNEALDALAKSRMKLMTVFLLMKKWSFKEEVIPVNELSSFLGEEPIDMYETLKDLEHDGIITITNGTISEFHQDNAWNVLQNWISSRQPSRHP